MANKDDNKYPFKRNGYVYSKGTRKGFMRMQRMGIPRPLFSIEDRLKKIVAARYKEFVKQIIRDIKNASRVCNVTLDGAPEDDTLESLLKFFDDMRKEAQADNQDIINKANMGAVENTLTHQWLDNTDDAPQPELEGLRGTIEKVLQKEQDDYLVRLFKDASGEMQTELLNMALDKQKVFNEHMDTLKQLYLDNSIQRLSWEQDYIKRCVLRRIHDYVSGKSATLELDDVTKYAAAKGDNMARLFARDQMQRFNKALTLSTFVDAGVTKVKWITCRDQRVRDTHKALDGQIFDVQNLPPEVDDYNCRCGLVPVEWAN